MEKTCLNCGNRMNDCVRFKSGTGAIYVRECGHHEWDTLEQRYAQLEQVAMEMYKFIASTCTDEAYVIQPKFCDQLEALGVNIDD